MKRYIVIGFLLGMGIAVANAASGSGARIRYSPPVSLVDVTPTTVTTPFIDAGVAKISEIHLVTGGARKITDNGFNLVVTGAGIAVAGDFRATTSAGIYLDTGGTKRLYYDGSTMRFNGDLLVEGDINLPTTSAGSCTLNGGTPSTCTATVAASSFCVCAPVGTTAVIAAGGCAVSLASTTLTVTGPATANYDANYHCFK